MRNKQEGQNKWEGRRFLLNLINGGSKQLKGRGGEAGVGISKNLLILVMNEET